MQAGDRTGRKVLGLFWSDDVPELRPWLTASDVLERLGAPWQMKSAVRRITALQSCGMLRANTGKLEHWENGPHTRGVQWCITDAGIELLREYAPDVRLKWLD